MYNCLRKWGLRWWTYKQAFCFRLQNWYFMQVGLHRNYNHYTTYGMVDPGGGRGRVPPFVITMHVNLLHVCACVLPFLPRARSFWDPGSVIVPLSLRVLPNSIQAISILCTLEDINDFMGTIGGDNDPFRVYYMPYHPWVVTVHCLVLLRFLVAQYSDGDQVFCIEAVSIPGNLQIFTGLQPFFIERVYAFYTRRFRTNGLYK